MASTKEQVAEAQKNIDLTNKVYTAELDTSKGPIRLSFLPDKAPGHVKNFLALAQAGFYNGVKFHRVIKGFMIQGGCPKGDGTGGPGYTIKAEFNDTSHDPGVLSMARTSDPNSAGSQFFICLERTPHLDRQYTAFGRTADAESLKTVKAIGEVSTGRNDRPAEDVVVRKVTVTEKPKG
jgi:peptidyl-prolyl cis-trans isomerase B (cyclophilin B)